MNTQYTYIYLKSIRYIDQPINYEVECEKFFHRRLQFGKKLINFGNKLLKTTEFSNDVVVKEELKLLNASQKMLKDSLKKMRTAFRAFSSCHTRHTNTNIYRTDRFFSKYHGYNPSQLIHPTYGMQQITNEFLNVCVNSEYFKNYLFIYKLHDPSTIKLPIEHTQSIIYHYNNTR